MSIPTVAHVFESGINAAPASAMENNSLDKLDALVRLQLAAASRELAMNAGDSSSPDNSKNLISDVGEYLTQTAQMFPFFAIGLLAGPSLGGQEDRLRGIEQTLARLVTALLSGKADF